MRRVLIPAIVGSVLTAYAGPLLAQGPGGREGPGGGHPGGGQPGGVRSSGPAGAGPQRENAPRATQPERGPRAEGGPRGMDRSQRTEPQQPNHQRERATERDHNRAASEGRAEQRRNAERERSAERARSAERERKVDRDKSEQRRNAERDRNARARSVERERDGRNEKRVDDQQRRQGEQLDRRDRQVRDRVIGGDRVAERHEEIRRARDRLAPNERQRFHTAFDFRRARINNARFDHHVGHRVPRHIHLYPVSHEIISFFPYYRGYSYVVVDDEICIVDPRTYEIVDVIDQGYYRGGPRQEVAGLSLSSAQIALVRDSIPRHFPATPLRLRLALGAEIPRDVEVYEFPAIVLDRVSELRDYRFLVVEEQIVIVDPRDHSIALVIDRA
jgi:Protein of unknown function (DUF1236)